MGKPAATLEKIRAECLDPFGIGTGILSCLYGVQLLFSEDMAAYARAVYGVDGANGDTRP